MSWYFINIKLAIKQLYKSCLNYKKEYYVYTILIRVSQLVNTIFAGHYLQTFSARNWERKKHNKINLVLLIDICFVIIAIISKKNKIYHSNHCRDCYINWILGKYNRQ